MMERSFESLMRSATQLLPGARRKRRESTPVKRLRIESLEPRVALSAAGLVPVGSQPAGALSGKIVYTSGGHGWEWNSSVNGYYIGRVETNEMVEAYGNQDQLAFYADYLLRSGATVVPLRPVGRQINEVVLDNDSAGVTFSGGWSNSTGARHYDEDYGAVADTVSYRFANAAATETAVATYTPNIPQAGFYPVYTWVAHGSNRTSQLYQVNHTGGQTEIRVDHSKVGNGWVYLGTYYFESGSSAAAGSVEISNAAPGAAGGSVVIADAIRFGNGKGDVKGGSGGIGAASGVISGKPREDEAALLWLWRAVGQGVGSPSTVVGTDNVSAPGKMAEHMSVNSNPFGTSLYVGFHSNAFNTAARGTVGLVSSSSPTPNQSALSTYIARQIQTDMQTRTADFEHGWATRGFTLAGAYGEINANNFSNGSAVEMDATLIEVAFHDNLEDANLLRDPKGRDQIARSAYEGTLEYFINHGGVTNNVTVASKPLEVSAVSAASGAVTLSWKAGATGVYGHAATGFRIYASVDGYGFDGGTYVAGGATTSATLTGYDPGLAYFFKIVAVNAGGESLASEVVAAVPTGGAKQVLIVNGFDRYDRTQNVRYAFAPGTDGLVDRVWARYNNSFDYVVQVASAIQTAASGVHVASASNEAVLSGAINLADYDAVIWILGNESTDDRTFSASEQAKVEAFIASGGHFFLSGSEIGWDLDQSNNGRTFYESTLQGNYVANAANTYNVTATAGSIFSGLSFSFDNGTRFYNVNSADVIAPQAGATLALNYSGGTGGGAAIQVAGASGRGSIVMLAFPFETITTAANRAAVMDRVLGFFNIAPSVPTGDFNGDGTVDGNDFLAWQRGYGMANPTLANGDADQNGIVDAADLTTWKAQFGTSGPPATVSSASASSSAITAEQTAAQPVTKTTESLSAPPTPTALAAPRSEALLPWLAQRSQQTGPTTPTPRQELNALKKSRSLESRPSIVERSTTAPPTMTQPQRHTPWDDLAPTAEPNALDLAFSDERDDSEWLTRY